MTQDNLKDRLNRFQSSIAPKPKKPVKKGPPERYLRLAKAMGGELVNRPAGSYVLVKRLYPLHYRHGNRLLRDMMKQEQMPVSAFTLQAEGGTLDLGALLFVDIETTGLGGSGAVAFLIGFGSVVAEGFEVRQYLIPDYSDECAMLEDILAEFAAFSTPVSYNGAAFDLPLIRDRMIINRVARDLQYERHVDLLHATRRLFKRRLKDCTLGSVERNLFEMERTDDIPGYLVPSVYFDWLSEEQLDLMDGVLEHNRLDIVSLLFLAVHIARVGESEGEVLDQVDDLHSLSRVYGRRKETGLVSNVYKRIDELNTTGLADDILLYHSLNFKRQKDLNRAVPIWKKLSTQDSREGYWANIEMAKYYEHTEKDPRRALACAVRAEQISPYGESQQRRLANRLKRLRAKIVVK